MTLTPLTRKIAGVLALVCLMASGMVLLPALAHTAQEAIALHRLDRLHDKLALTGDQQPLWDHAEQMTKGNIQRHFEKSQQRQATVLAALDNPQVDLRKLAAEQDQGMKDAMAAHQQVRDAWLAVYDSLNPTQKATVLAVLKKRVEHAQHRRQAMLDRLSE
ncbi:MAG: periplasmic heavy metal sensor [Stenotrophobium sp.]